MAFSVIYYGFVRGGCICPVGAAPNAAMGILWPEACGRATSMLFLLPLVAAFFFGRGFCSSACPLGALQHFVSGKRCFNWPSWSSLIPALILFGTVFFALKSMFFLICFLDPYRIIFAQGRVCVSELNEMIFNGAPVEPFLVFAGNWIAWGVFGLALAASYFIPRVVLQDPLPLWSSLGAGVCFGLQPKDY